jgi:hypothetical protein
MNQDKISNTQINRKLNSIAKARKESTTPYLICKDMLNLLPKDFFTAPDNSVTSEEYIKTHRILDIHCKSGDFLVIAYHKFMYSLLYKIPDEVTRKEFIWKNLLYGICDNDTTATFLRIKLYGSNNIRGNIYICKDIKAINNLRETELNMEFTVVVGNPPYNNDIYLDFVTKAKEISTKYVVMITPAKWQAKQDNAKAKIKVNENFRQNIVPYMSHIVMYRNSHDVFVVDENAGISYYLIDSKEKHTNKNIKNICKNNATLNSDFEIHDEEVPVLCNRNILQVLGKIGQLGEGFKQSIYVQNTDWGESGIIDQLGFKRCTFVDEQERGEALKQASCVEIVQGEEVTGYKHINQLKATINLDKYKCTCSCMIGYGTMLTNDSDKVYGSPYINIVKPYQVPKGSFPVLRYFDTEFEAKSFRSYIQSKTCSLLFYMGICGATVTSSFFRFIPDQVNYNKIYEDSPLPEYKEVSKANKGEYTDSQGNKHCALYDKYGLEQDEIDIIESIIKERK